MKVLSLFDGIGAGRLALERSGIEVKKYYRSEIDKFANQVADKNYPDSVSLGDVTKWKEWDIKWDEIDLLIGGSPCQGFSFAGKQLAFNDPRSALFFTYVDILNHIKKHNPNVKFMLENVKMKKEHLNVISEYLGVNPVFINSSLVSAQNRQRYYWANWNIKQPKDKGILLKDVIQQEVNAEFNLSEKAIKYMYRLRNGKPRWEFHKNNVNGKAACLTASMHKGVPYGALKLYNKIVNCNGGIYQIPRGFNNGNVFTEKCPTITRNSWEHNNFYIVNESATKQGKSYSLTASQGNCVAWNSIERKQRTTIPVCNSNDENPNVYNNILYRKLTPIECERLQTFPDDWTDCVSNSQRYKQLGNSWTVDVISHIFNQMKD